MRTIRYKEALVYYDGVQVFSARDKIGGGYVCVLTEADEGPLTYVTVGVSPARLREFITGELDLRTVMLNREDSEWFTVSVENELDEDLPLYLQKGEIPEDMLPAEGFLLAAPRADEPLVQRVSRVRNNVVLEISVNPPEAATDPKIRASTLASLVALVQSIVKHAYNRALAGLSSGARSTIDTIEAHQLDALAFSQGSFRLIFESAKGPDLFGYVEVQRALEKLDEITANTDSPTKALDVLKSNQGHLAGAYIRLLDFIIKNRTPLSYQWTTPAAEFVRGREISEKQAKPLFETFTKSLELGVEIIELHGFLRKADSKSNTWRLESIEDKVEYSGDVKEGVTVSNLVIDKIYRFSCEERLEEQPATGRETRRLSLLKYTEG